MQEAIPLENDVGLSTAAPKRQASDAMIIDSSDSDQDHGRPDPYIRPEKRFRVETSIPKLTKGYRQAVRRSENWNEIKWDWFHMCQSFRQMAVIIETITRDSYAFYIGVTKGPLWRFFGARHHGMRPHVERFTDLCPLTCLTKGYAATGERWLIRYFREDGRLANIDDGGEGISGEEIDAYFLYVARAYNAGERVFAF